MPEDCIKHPHLTLIKGGKITDQEFIRLSVPEKLTTLRHLPARKRLDLLIADPDGPAVTAELQAQELFWMVKELGETDSLELFELASPEQYSFMLDVELWEKWSFSRAKALTWLGYLLESTEEKVMAQVHNLDFELLLLLLRSEITVAGGIGELLNDEQRLQDWDHSFDNIFFITFVNHKNARLIGTLLDIIYRNDSSLYRGLMTGVQNEVESELEELCWQFRTGRLADFGFPSIDEALSVYARTDPAGFVVSEDKVQTAYEVDTVPAPFPLGETVLQRALALLDSAEVQLELNYLINNALVAEETAFADTEGIEMVCKRVYGYLNTALEYLAGADDRKAADIVAGEQLKRLFQLGHSLVVELKKRAGKLASDNYAANKALIGLKAKRPNFYRGLDPDMADGYREFQGMTDIHKMEEFLRSLEAQ